MDWIKREMYMDAKQKLESGKRYFVCHALIAVLVEYTGISPDKELSYINWKNENERNYQKEKLLQEFFPEFTRLNDGKVWEGDGVFRKQVGPHDAWWDNQWSQKDPRILILDTILRD